MNKKLKAEWIKALTSGRYAQGRDRLEETIELPGKKKTKEYCCLGVLCKIAPKVAKPGNQCDDEDDVVEGELLTKSSAKAIFGEEGVIIQQELADMNDFWDGEDDVEGVPFEVIAGFVQENL